MSSLLNIEVRREREGGRGMGIQIGLPCVRGEGIGVTERY